MKQAIAIGLLLLTLSCGQDRVKTQESRIHGDVIKIFPCRDGHAAENNLDNDG